MHKTHCIQQDGVSCMISQQAQDGHGHCKKLQQPPPMGTNLALPACPSTNNLLWMKLSSRLVCCLLQPQLRAGAGFTGRDTQSGMLLLDRQRWLKVLYWTFWINTWHDQLYENCIYGDKVSMPLTRS